MMIRIVPPEKFRIVNRTHQPSTDVETISNDACRCRCFGCIVPESMAPEAAAGSIVVKDEMQK
jgi:hypothetical protein